MSLKPCDDCGKIIDISLYPCYYNNEDEEICKECHEKRHGKEIEGTYI